MQIWHLDKQREKLHKDCQGQNKCLQVFFPGGQHDKILAFFYGPTHYVICELERGKTEQTFKALEYMSFHT